MITDTEVKKILPSGLKIILDGRYNLPTDEEVSLKVRDFIALRGNFVYVEDSHDCDNAAVEMLAYFSGSGWAVGVAILEGHSAILYINKDKKLKFIEPQTGEIFKPTTRLKITVII